MLRTTAVIALLFATPCFAQDLQTGPVQAHHAAHDRFIIANDDCGASQYSRYVGQSYQMYRTALPGSAVVHHGGLGNVTPVADHEQQSTQPMTLEFRSRQLNIVVDASARIVAVGCY